VTSHEQALWDRSLHPGPRRRGTRRTGTVAPPAVVKVGERAVAQSGSALVWGARGRRFKSGQPDDGGSAVRIFDIGGPEVPRTPSDRIVTVPNLLSVGRIVVLPFVLLDLVAGRLSRALVVLVLIGASDWFDGYLARVLDQRTRLGAVLDPIGDRAVFIVVGTGLVIADLLPLWALVILLAREGAVVVVGGVLLLRGASIPETSRLGKVATSGLMLSITGLLAAAALGDGPEDPLRWLHLTAWGGLIVNLTLTYLSTVGYARAAVSGGEYPSRRME
jgi:cardiolipin synthase